MKLCLFVILMIHVVHSQADGAVTGLVGEQVILPCIYKGQTSLLPSNIRFHWQTLSNQVVYAFDEGKHQPTNQADRFKDRTMVSQSPVENGNLSLQIRSLTLADEGLYTCYLFTMVPELRMIYQCNVRLQIAAHFNTPEISKGEAILPGEEVNLTCRSSGGYPAPTVDWTDGEGNSLLGNRPVVTSPVPDPATRLWNVTSVLQVKAPTNSNFTCSVHNNRTGETGKSTIRMVPGVTNQQTKDPGRGYLTAVYVLVAFFVFAGLFTFIVRWLRQRKIRASLATRDGMENHAGAGISSTEMQNLSESRGRKKPSPGQEGKGQPTGASSTEEEEEEEMIAPPTTDQR